MFEEQRGNYFVWVAAALLLLAVGYRVMNGRTPTPPAVEVQATQAVERPRKGNPSARLYVHVAGAVRRPGLYRVAPGARVAAAVELAGGPRRSADLTTTNLAAKLEDGQQIVVPVRGQAPAPAAPPGSAPGAAGVAGAPGAQPPISLATATQEQLEALHGIGPALAQAILAYRDANGGFRSIEELQEVDGIGEVRFESLRQAVRP